MGTLGDLRLRQVEDSHALFASLSRIQRPKGGWVKAVRTALGMSTRQLASRIGVSQPMVSQYERSETEDAITLGTLRKVGEALGCNLVYALIPRQPLSTMIENQARRVSERRFREVDESMALEGQMVDSEELERQIDDYARHLRERKPGAIWEE